MVMVVIASCYFTDEKHGCEDGEVRLHGGIGPSDGRVEFCHERTWVGVCREGWDAKEARIVCSQLNFQPEGTCNCLCPYLCTFFSIEAVIIEEPVGIDISKFLVQTTCKGSERYFNECKHSMAPSHGCASVAISCVKSSGEVM